MKKSAIHTFSLFLVFVGISNLSFAQDNTLEANENEIIEPDTITIAFHPYEPFYDNKGHGFAAEIYIAAFASQNIKVEMQPLPIKRGIRKLLANDVDAFSPGTLFIRQPENLDKLQWVNSALINIVWFHKRGNDPNSKLDLSGSLLISPATNRGLDYLEPYMKKGLTRISVEDPRRSLEMIARGRADYAVFSQLTGWHSILNHNISNPEQLSFTLMREPFPVNLAFLKSVDRSQRLYRNFITGMSEITKNGQYIAILERYWGKGNIPKSVLFDELKSQGSDFFDLSLFIKAHQSRLNNQSNQEANSIIKNTSKRELLD
jgi:ABC-type amino acid transport substrate-binding protein